MSDDGKSPTNGMKRLASPKMRHVRALSPYANSRGTEAGPDAKASFLSMGAIGLNSEDGKNYVKADINEQRADFQDKLD
jgi:hypothetical protein